MTTTRPLAGIALSLVLAACGIGGEGRVDTIAGVTSGARADRAPAPDTVPQEVVVAPRGAPRDVDHAFLRDLADHHEAAVELGSDAMSRGAAATTRAAGHALHTSVESQRDSIVALVKSLYGEELVPRLSPEARATADSVAVLTGPAHDQAFYRAAIAHQRAGESLVAERQASLLRPEVRRLAERVGVRHRERAAQLEKSAAAAP